MMSIRRVINLKNLLIYSFAYMLLFLFSDQGDTVVEICGGFAVSRFAGLNAIQIMQWVLCVLPPIFVSMLFMEEELKYFAIYTMIRAKNIRQWWCVHWLAVFLINLIYPVLFTIVSDLTSINRVKLGEDFVLFFFIFEIHILTMSVISVLIKVVCKSLNMAVLFFGVVEIAMVAIGSLVPKLSIYLFPFWGMVENENYLLQTRGEHLFITIGISTVLIAFCVFCTLICLRGEMITNVENW